MKKLFLLYAIALSLAVLASSEADASTDYDIDWPTSISGKQHILRITIDSCVTLIKIKDSDLEKFSNDKTSLKEVVQIAIKHTLSGCN
jgi:hypothetical protein